MVRLWSTFSIYLCPSHSHCIYAWCQDLNCILAFIAFLYNMDKELFKDSWCMKWKDMFYPSFDFVYNHFFLKRREKTFQRAAVRHWNHSVYFHVITRTFYKHISLNILYIKFRIYYSNSIKLHKKSPEPHLKHKRKNRCKKTDLVYILNILLFRSTFLENKYSHFTLYIAFVHKQTSKYTRDPTTSTRKA